MGSRASSAANDSPDVDDYDDDEGNLAVPCESRTPVVGEGVESAEGTQEAEHEHGGDATWFLHDGEVALVVGVDSDGDFKLKNPAGEISVWQYRNNYVYVDRDARIEARKTSTIEEKVSQPEKPRHIVEERVALPAAPKKKFQAPMDVSKLMKARSTAGVKAPAAQTKPLADSKQSAAKPSNGVAHAPSSTTPEKPEDLPKGDEGFQWEALEDSIVRTDKDIKSARVGALQTGELCTQTGPWRAEPSGRVRMPISGPRGVEGWVTVDTRRCRNADGEWGTLSLKMLGAPKSKPTPVVEETPAPKPAPQRRWGAKRDEVSEVLDILGDIGFGTQEEANNDDDNAMSDDEDAESPDEAAALPDDEADDAEFTADVEVAPRPPPPDSAPPPPPKTVTREETKQELTQEQKDLRSIRKKLREIESLEKLEAPTDLQNEKISRKGELQTKEAELTREVKKQEAEARRAALGLGPKPKRKKAKSNAKVASSKGSCACLTKTIALSLPLGGLAAVVAAYYWQSLAHR
eukprot:TRINITY_DN22046_c0_g1_i2.p1 TRINITY_DN22046_c0_g1~~TRINITY_DN22046_c0_g1_i2.p1  ORF type:complete len:533 (+),score=100.78 TRINITY_DN22046_c0_g1_i2:40-1599(+)